MHAAGFLSQAGKLEMTLQRASKVLLVELSAAPLLQCCRACKDNLPLRIIQAECREKVLMVAMMTIFKWSRLQEVYLKLSACARAI